MVRGASVEAGGDGAVGLGRAARFGHSGLTVIELMVAVAIVALLTSLAVPSYRSYLNRSKVATATADIRSIESKLMRYYSDNGHFPTTLADAGIDPVDPWGHPYSYLPMEGAKVGKVRKDRSLHPLNTDYDLYSMGADGKSATPLTAKISQDDIIRARDGAFVGLAQDF